MRSIIRWAGSKRKLLPQISQYWIAAGAERRYVEPFAGSAAFLFHAQPERSVLNDSNAELVEALKALKADPIEIYTRVAAIPKEEQEYYRIRSLDPINMPPLERACRFFYLNRNCFNGIYRVNQRGQFNVPFAKSKSGNLPAIDEWLAASTVLQGAELLCEDFEVVCRRVVGESDFVYLDPPYAVSNRRVFRQYGLNSFGLEDMQRLALLLEELDERGAKFLVSYAFSPESRLLASRWFTKRTRAQRNVAGFREHRRNAVEVLISNVKV